MKIVGVTAVETNDLREAAEMALEVLLKYRSDDAIQQYAGIQDSITFIRQALAQEDNHESLRLATKDYIQELEDRIDEYILKEEQQEPVAWMYVNTDGECEQIEYGKPFDDPSVTPLYTAPPKREWVGLTDEDKVAIYQKADDENWHDEPLLEAVEAKLKEKNT